ncbi:hypothetical protein AB0E04_10625 [Streptomyces sp. NPDC048251]
MNRYSVKSYHSTTVENAATPMEARDRAGDATGEGEAAQGK